MTVGVSYDLNNVYRAINYVGPKSGSALSHLQAMHRFRHVKDQTLFLEGELGDPSCVAFSPMDYYVSAFNEAPAFDRLHFQR